MWVILNRSQSSRIAPCVLIVYLSEKLNLNLTWGWKYSHNSMLICACISTCVCRANHSAVGQHFFNVAKWNQGWEDMFAVENIMCLLTMLSQTIIRIQPSLGSSPHHRCFSKDLRKHVSYTTLWSSAGPLRKLLCERCSLGHALC